MEDQGSYTVVDELNGGRRYRRPGGTGENKKEGETEGTNKEH